MIAQQPAWPVGLVGLKDHCSCEKFSSVYPLVFHAFSGMQETVPPNLVQLVLQVDRNPGASTYFI